MVNAGLLLIRVVFGLLMASHGAQKLFGWFGGYGLSGVGGYFESLGFRPGRTFALAAGLAETVGGVLVALGLLGPVGPALVISVMIVAAATVHWSNGVFATENGVEVPLLYGVVMAALALSGPGSYSLDAVLGLTALWEPAVVFPVLAIGVIGGFAALATRRQLPQPVAA